MAIPDGSRRTMRTGIATWMVAAQSARKETWLARRADILARAGRTDQARSAYAAALTAIEALPAATRRTKAVAELEGRVRRALAPQ